MDKIRQAALLTAVTVLLQATSAFSVGATAATDTQQVAGYYRYSLGDYRITALYDGYVMLPTTVFQGMVPESVRQTLDDHFIDTENGVQTAINAFLIDSGDQQILIDSGAAKCFGDTGGSIESNLSAAGYTTDDVDIVLLTHLHPDHACGISAAAGKKSFPNATVYVNQIEADYWLNMDNLYAMPEEAQAGAKSVFEEVKAAVAPYQASKQFQTYHVGDTVTDAIQIVPTYGHTIGHSSYLVTSNEHSIMLVGDIVHNHALQFANPKVSLAFDSDPEQAIKTRQAQFKQAAQAGYLIGAPHLPFPGLGHVLELDNGSYRWLPVEYAPMP